MSINNRLLPLEGYPTYRTYVDRYNITDAYELDAMDPDDAAEVIHSAIMAAVDIDQYHQELAAEEAESARSSLGGQQANRSCSVDTQCCSQRWQKIVFPPREVVHSLSYSGRSLEKTSNAGLGDYRHSRIYRTRS